MLKYVWPFSGDLTSGVKGTAWKVSKDGVNSGKCGPEITPYLDTFHAARVEDGGDVALSFEGLVVVVLL